MGENSRIEWTDHTFNPWIGCTKISDGCKHCYAEALMDKRYGRAQWGPQGTRVRTSEAYWRKPLAWNRRAETEGRRYHVFCASLADVFEDRPELVPWRTELFELIAQTPNLDWLLLTKRPENVLEMVPWGWHTEDAGGYLIDGGEWPANVWIGTSVENQGAANERIPHLLRIPARYRFLSMEPLLGPVDFRTVDGFNRYNLSLHGFWVIVGGESGPNARPMHPDWVRSLRDQCQAAGVAFHFKQWGEWIVSTHAEQHMPPGKMAWPWAHRFPDGDIEGDTTMMLRVGKRFAGRLLDGREWNEFPAGSEPAHAAA